MRARRKQNTRSVRRLAKRRNYHLADDVECAFDYELPEWLVGAD